LFEARVLEVLIASPGDISWERQAVVDVVARLNSNLGADTAVILLPRRWEFDAVPQMGGDGQSIINEQMVDGADVVIAIFHNRLGSRTPRADSGTVEEIDRAVEMGKSVHIYVSEMDRPSDVDPDELKRMKEGLAAFYEQGLLGRYDSKQKFVDGVQSALTKDIIANARLASAPQDIDVPAARPAALRAQYAKGSGNIDYILVQNRGDEAAYDVSVELEAEGPGEPPHFLEEPEVGVLPELSEYRIPIALVMSTSLRGMVRMKWKSKPELADPDQGYKHSISFSS
jgi:nucleoside 2-deoxyribosyltransferase